MDKVILETAHGGYVGTFSVPKFNAPPEVLTWGTRTFIPMPGRSRDFMPVYREAFAVAIVSQPEPEDDGA
jgi:hypothetical protein